ncbi:hypothetical protein ACQ4M4_19695 [Leptolyngbya sp. AN02str]|uniref:hypothetical protein n=1 Tax=Leptolyngbya sp. AN02str TaxID=3423363 RepID=UPI003D31149C
MVSGTPQAGLPPEVDLTVLLEGGQQHTIRVEPQNPLLQQLFETLIAKPEDRGQRVFQIPVKDGKAILCFPSDRLVGVVTEPPLIVQPQGNQQPATQPGVDPLAPGM